MREEVTPRGIQKPKSQGPTSVSENFVTSKGGREGRGGNDGARTGLGLLMTRTDPRKGNRGEVGSRRELYGRNKKLVHETLSILQWMLTVASKAAV